MREAARSGRLHHAWLIAGAAGIGKATLAFRFARALLAGFPGDGLDVPPAHPVFRRVAHGTHADLALLERAWDDRRKRVRTEIVADDVRAIGGFLSLTPAEGGWRVVVVDGAEHLNRSAANAMLKLLEEPPSRAILLLVSAAPGRLLPTIRSRCRTLRLAPLGEAAVADALGTLLPGTDAATRQRLAAGAAGSPGRAIGAASPEHARMQAEVERVLADEADAIALADRVARAEDGLGMFADLLRCGLEARARAFAATDPAGAARDAASSLRVGALRDEAERFNLDRRQTVLAALEEATARTRP